MTRFIALIGMNWVIPEAKAGAMYGLLFNKLASVPQKIMHGHGHGHKLHSNVVAAVNRLALNKIYKAKRSSLFYPQSVTKKKKLQHRHLHLNCPFN